MRKTNIILLGSNSRGKTHEFAELFKAYPQIEFKALNEIVWNPASFDEVEKGKTYFENAFAKCQLAHLAAKVPTIADDSGLEVDALPGKLGVRSSRYATAKANESQDEANNRQLLEELKGVPADKRTARFVCTIAFMVEGVVLQAEGKLEGHIVDKPSGAQGFGYDPIFVPNGYDKTLAELGSAEKNKISHRAKALAGIMDLIKQKNVELVRP